MISSTWTPATDPNSGVTFAEMVAADDGTYASTTDPTTPAFVNINHEIYVRAENGNIGDDSIPAETVPPDARFIRLAGTLTMTVVS